MKYTKEDLKRFQDESLPEKIQRSMAKIGEWYCRWNDNVYVSFSGGKDSEVLSDLCAKWCKLTKATLYLLFVNTGLEYPEIQKFVKEFAEYLRKKYEIEVVLDIIRPKMRFDEVIKKYGYPIISKEVSECVYYARNGDGKYKHQRLAKLKGEFLDAQGNKSIFNLTKYYPLIGVDFESSDKCCKVMKKAPAHQYSKQTGRKPITAQMASESRLRTQQWLKNGCNGFDMKSPISNPMSFWLNQDVLQYIKEEKLPICSVYGEIAYEKNPAQIRFEIEGEEEKLVTTRLDRTGCIFCAFGCHLEKSPSRFEMLKITHPKQYKYCIFGGAYDENGIWMPNEEGLGMGHIFDELNAIYGEDFIKY